MKESSQENGAGEPTGTATGYPTVLVIDDSEIALAQMSRLLQSAGMRVVDLASPIGATRAITTHSVDVVVIDFLMPGMRGDRLAALFRGNPRFKKLGVVIVSGESSPDFERLSKEAGADAIVKKAELNKLVPAIRAALRAHAGRPGHG
jgi:two-component system, chemotaxis family, sensor kinase CheA